MMSDRTYEYFSLNDHEPLIRVRSKGLPIGGMRIDRNTGEFVRDATVMSLVERSPDIDDISDIRFFELVEQFRQKLGFPI